GWSEGMRRPSRSCRRSESCAPHCRAKSDARCAASTRPSGHPARHGGKNLERVPLADLRFEAVEHADVFVVEVDVDEAVELAVGAEQLGLELAVLGDEVVQDLLDGAAVGVDLSFAADGGTEDRRDANGGHVSGP